MTIGATGCGGSSGVAEARMARIRERLASTSSADTQLRVMLVLTHELLRHQASSRTTRPRVAWQTSAPPAADRSMSPRDYRNLIARVRDTVDRKVPPGARLLVVSRGDDALLFQGFDAIHFPHGPDGVYAGHYPADSAAAIAHLEDCRAAGAEFLALPSTGYWWLDYYGGLARHLLVSARVTHHGNDCAIFDMRLHRDGGSVL
jgi:hypothetical protein